MAILSAHEKLNLIRETATSAYQTEIPLATMDNISDVGIAVMTAPAVVKNEFFDAILNQIGKVLIKTADFVNPLSDLRKEAMPYGSTIEDIFVEMAKSKQYISGTRDGEDAPDQFEVNKAEVLAAFYQTQLERQYTVTISEHDLRRAFTSNDPVSSLVSAKVKSITTAEQFDDYRMTVALIARQIEESVNDVTTGWNGAVHLLTDYNALFTKTLTAADCLYDQDFLRYMSEQMQTWSDRLIYPRKDMNPAGVNTSLAKGSQHLMMLGDVKAKVSTNLLAFAYNANHLELGSVRHIDAWYSLGADATATPVVTPDSIEVKADLGLGGANPCIGLIYDPEMLVIHNKFKMTENARNARGHYTNIWHTVADIYAASPYHNFVAFFLD
ncbi:MAG: hypothetical protein EOM07_05135 [Clostridia bacterium]|nr:hypothetical protein [Clostridia bacterium]